MFHPFILINMEKPLEFARESLKETNSYYDTEIDLRNEFPELSEAEIREVLAALWEEKDQHQRYKGEQQSDLERGN